MTSADKALDSLTEWQISRATGNPDLEHEKATSMLKAIKSFLQRHHHYPEATAPKGVLLLVHGAGGWRTGLKDDMGNWRGRHGGTVKHPPTRWMHMPEAPQ